MADLIQIPIADDLPCPIRNPVVVDEAIERSQVVPVDEFHQGVQFLDPVFDRGAGQDQGKSRFQLFDCFRSTGFPVLDPLRLVENDQIGRPFPDQIQVSGHQLVVDQLVERSAPVEPPSLLIQALDDLRRPVCGFGKSSAAVGLFFPLGRLSNGKWVSFQPFFPRGATPLRIRV
jgi:hypothetical protein